MNILLLGSGGREHALAWKLAQSPLCDRLFAAPGNPGIGQHATCVTLDAADHPAVIALCERESIGLVVIGPEAPLVDGLADSLRGAGTAVFGPSRSAARLEGSKGFTKDLCARAGIPTAGYLRVRSREEADAAITTTFSLPLVIKADGLAAGKGVTIAYSREEVDAALDRLFDGGEAEAGEVVEAGEGALDGLDLVIRVPEPQRRVLRGRRRPGDRSGAGGVRLGREGAGAGGARRGHGLALRSHQRAGWLRAVVGAHLARVEERHHREQRHREQPWAQRRALANGVRGQGAAG